MVGIDPLSDLAVLRAVGGALPPPVTLGDADGLASASWWWRWAIRSASPVR